MGGYDSEIYANDQLVNNGGKYTPRSPPISLGTNNSRYLGNGKVSKWLLFFDKDILLQEKSIFLMHILSA